MTTNYLTTYFEHFTTDDIIKIDPLHGYQVAYVCASILRRDQHHNLPIVVFTELFQKVLDLSPQLFQQIPTMPRLARILHKLEVPTARVKHNTLKVIKNHRLEDPKIISERLKIDLSINDIHSYLSEPAKKHLIYCVENGQKKKLAQQKRDNIKYNKASNQALARLAQEGRVKFEQVFSKNPQQHSLKATIATFHALVDYYKKLDSGDTTATLPNIEQLSGQNNP